MVTKVKTLYECNACGAQYTKWQGRCSQCGAWNTLIEARTIQSNSARFEAWSSTVSEVQSLAEVSAELISRQPIGMPELDQVLGGGLVQGGVMILGGDPGIGKSTLFLQVLASLTRQGQQVLYISGEESAQQVSLRAKRMHLNVAHVPILTEINIEHILFELRKIKPQFVVVDSIQTLYAQEINSAPGSVSQVRECAAQLTRYAKQTGAGILLIGHVTKDGSIAGPRVLEHMVDTVLYFEGDTHSNYRMIRSIKNRFGAVNELGIFAMLDKGLVGVSNPSAIFLSSYREDTIGSCVLVTQEGTRPLLIEIQALVDQAQGPNPKRLSVGLETNRLSMLLAVLSKHAGLAISNQDVFINAVGGVKINEPAADLAVVLAIYSSLKNKALRHKTLVFGEVGLSGEIRPVQRGQERLKEGEKLGFEYAIIPQANMPKDKKRFPRLTVQGVNNLNEALSECLMDHVKST